MTKVHTGRIESIVSEIDEYAGYDVPKEMAGLLAEIAANAAAERPANEQLELSDAACAPGQSQTC